VWEGEKLGGPSSRGLEKQYLSYMYCSKIIIMAQKGRKCEKNSSKRTSISVIFSDPKLAHVNFRSQNQKKN